jgi:hypothetical protein
MSASTSIPYLSILLLTLWVSVQPPLIAQVQDDPPIGRHYDIPVITELPPPEDTYRIGKNAVADLTGDGRNSIVFFGITPGTGQTYDSDPEPLYVMAPNEDGVLVDRTYELVASGRAVLQGGAHSILPADYNNDGRMDLFLSIQGTEIEGPTDPGGQNWLLLSGEDGRLRNVTATHLPQYSDKTHFPTIGDYDGDGDVDIFINNLVGPPEWARESPGEQGYLMFNDGTGHFTIVADFGGSGPRAVVGPNGRLPDDVSFRHHHTMISIDADGDGDLDIYIGQTTEVPICETFPNCEETQTRIILLNDGEGRFLERLDPTPDLGPPQSDDFQDAIRTATHNVYDVNNDGLDDLVLKQGDLLRQRNGQDPGFFQILISNGDGTFRDETSSRLPAWDAYHGHVSDVYLHDIDADGYQDIYYFFPFSTNKIHINDGEGFFRPMQDDWITRAGSQFSRIMDVDGDGGTDYYDMHREHFLSKMIEDYGAELDGSQDDDHFIGGAHDNVYRGYHGNDYFDGGLGNDWLAGGADDDTLIGGKGDDAYAWIASDLTGHDQLNDKLGEDRLRFMGFGLEQVSSASQDAGDLRLEFTDGGSVRIERHFTDPNYRIEFLQTDECIYYLSNDPAFVSGDISELLSSCIIHLSGFENRVPESELTDPCDIGSGTWATAARDCTVNDCVTFDERSYISWDLKVWCRAIESRRDTGWTLEVPEGSTTFNFWADWGGWGSLSFANCGDGQSDLVIESCGLNHTVHRGAEEQQLSCDVTGESFVTITQPSADTDCDLVLLGNPFFE